MNALLGVKDPHPLSIAITGLGGGAFLPAVGDRTAAEVQTGRSAHEAAASASVVDTTARCMFFAGLLLPLLLVVLICLPRPPSPSVRFWRVGKARNKNRNQNLVVSFAISDGALLRSGCHCSACGGDVCDDDDDDDDYDDDNDSKYHHCDFDYAYDCCGCENMTSRDVLQLLVTPT